MVTLTDEEAAKIETLLNSIDAKATEAERLQAALTECCLERNMNQRALEKLMVIHDKRNREYSQVRQALEELLPLAMAAGVSPIADARPLKAGEVIRAGDQMTFDGGMTWAGVTSRDTVYDPAKHVPIVRPLCLDRAEFATDYEKSRSTEDLKVGQDVR